MSVPFFHPASRFKTYLKQHETMLQKTRAAVDVQPRPWRKDIFTALLSLIALLFSSHLFAQNNAVTGSVSDSSGNPLSGVSVVVRGANMGTSTDASGKFQLNAVPARATLVISSVGMATQEIRLSGQSNLKVILKGDAGTLQDVVVTGFQRINRKDFTGAAVTIKADEIRQPGVVDVSRMLEGRAAGVSVQNVSSTFGSAPKVRIRGATSINGDNKPLWVVDGVVLEDIINISNDQLSSGDPNTLLGSSVAGLNANDIESFDILKDASATALYGARAMNGVIVITTKKGRAGRTSVNYTGNFTTQLKPQYSEYNIMNSAQQMSVLGELERKGLLSPNLLSNSNYGVYGKMYDFINNPDANGNFRLLNDNASRTTFLKRYAAANTDWFDLLFKNSLVQEHSLSVSTGTDKSQSFFSTSLYSDNGWTIADKVTRYTLNFRNNYNFNDRLSAGFMTTGSVRQQKAPGAISRLSNPVTGQYDRDFDINPFSYSLNTSRVMTAFDENGEREFFRRNYAPFNILTELENNRLKIDVMDLKLQGELGYKFNQHFRYEFIGALRYVKSSREHEITENSNMANAYRAGAGDPVIGPSNRFLYTDPDNPAAPPVAVRPYGGFYNRIEDKLLNFDFRNSIHYSNTFNGKHGLTALLGQQVKFADRQNFNNTGYGYQYDNGGIPFVDYRILKQTIESSFNYYGMGNESDRFAAFYFSSQYTYSKKYNVFGTVRYDGSNRLGSSPKARWLPTWTVGASWNVEEENFMQHASAIDYLKLRGSYGLTASLGPATNSGIVLRSGTSDRTFPSERESIIRLANLENSELTWEKNYTGNLGLEASLFNGRISTVIDVFKRKSFDLISTIRTPGIGGEALKAANYADMNSNGVEVQLGFSIIKKKDLSWKTNFTFGYNQTKIVNVKNVPRIFDLVQAQGFNTEGYPVNSLFSIRFGGLSHVNGTPMFVVGKDIKGEDSLSSNIYFQSQDFSNLKYEGSVDPTYTGGISNTFTYKAFSVNVFITYQGGNKIRLYPAFNRNYTDFDALPKEFIDRWVKPGDESITNIPSIVGAWENYQLGAISVQPYNSYNYSDQRVASGAFMRLKTVSLSYNVSPQLSKKLGMNMLTVTAVANNPWLIYSDEKLKGQDPEFFNTGGVAQPIQKQFTLSLKAGF
jgi:TonB-linked SusC/RagA family outer membrane protein